MIKFFKKELNVESTKVFIIKILNLLRQIKSVYKHNDIIQDIIQTKVLNQRKLFFEIIKNNVKLELKDCRIHKDLLYVNDKLYIFNDSKLRIKIIRDIYDISFGEHADKSFIYDRLFRHYY